MDVAEETGAEESDAGAAAEDEALVAAAVVEAEDGFEYVLVTVTMIVVHVGEGVYQAVIVEVKTVSSGAGDDTETVVGTGAAAMVSAALESICADAALARAATPTIVALFILLDDPILLKKSVSVKLHDYDRALYRVVNECRRHPRQWALTPESWHSLVEASEQHACHEA